MSEKIFGYILILSGLAIILGAGFNVYQIVTRQAQPVRLFDFAGITINANQLIAEPVTSIDLEGITSDQQAIVDELLKQQGTVKDSQGSGTSIEILPGDVLSETSNLFAHIILMGFLAGIGSKVAGIGTMLVRTIVVKVKEQKPKEEASVNG